MNKIRVRVADWQKDNAELRRIREAVFIAEQSVPPELEEDDLLASLEDGAILVRNPSARLAWSDVDDDLLLFASGQSRLLPGNLRELLILLCAADALHSDNLGQWLADDEGRNLLVELVKQGSLEFADE